MGPLIPVGSDQEAQEPPLVNARSGFSFSGDLAIAVPAEDLAIAQRFGPRGIGTIGLPAVLLFLAPSLEGKLGVTAPKAVIVLGPGTFAMAAASGPRLLDHLERKSHGAPPACHRLALLCLLYHVLVKNA